MTEIHALQKRARRLMATVGQSPRIDPSPGRVSDLHDLWATAEALEVAVAQMKWDSRLATDSPRAVANSDVAWWELEQSRDDAQLAFALVARELSAMHESATLVADPRFGPLVPELTRLARLSPTPDVVLFPPPSRRAHERQWTKVLRDLRADLGASTPLPGRDEYLFAEVASRHSNALAVSLSEAVRSEIQAAHAAGHGSQRAGIWSEYDVSDDFVESVQLRVRQSVQPLQTMFRRRAKFLRQPAMTVKGFTLVPHDGSERGPSVDQTWELLSEAFAPLGAWHRKIVNVAREDGWARIAQRAAGVGRSAGCAFAHGRTPRIVISWDSSWRGAFALAHELGHAIHRSVAANDNRPTIGRPPALIDELLPLVHELLLARYLADSDNPDWRRTGLLQQLELLQENVYAACSYVEYGARLEQEISVHGEITFARACDAYAGALEQIYGNTVDVHDSSISHLWARRTHSPQGYRCIRYVVAAIAAANLTQRLDDRVNDLLPFLKAGRSRPVLAQLNALGFDPNATSTYDPFQQMYADGVDEWSIWADSALLGHH